MDDVAVVVGVVVHVACSDSVVVSAGLVVSRTDIVAGMGSCVGTGIGIGTGIVGVGGGGSGFSSAFCFWCGGGFCVSCVACGVRRTCRMWKRTRMSYRSGGVCHPLRVHCTKTRSRPNTRARRWPTAPEGLSTISRAAIPGVGWGRGTCLRPTVRARRWPTASEGLPLRSGTALPGAAGGLSPSYGVPRNLVPTESKHSPV